MSETKQIVSSLSEDEIFEISKKGTTYIKALMLVADAAAQRSADLVKEREIAIVKATLAFCLEHEPDSVIKLINPEQVLERLK